MEFTDIKFRDIDKWRVDQQMNANANSKRDNEDTYITLPVQTVSEFSVDTKEQMDNENFDSGVFVVENYEPNYNENKAIDS